MGSHFSLALSPLAAGRLDHRALPPKPPSVCQTCWEGPIAAQLGLFLPDCQEKRKRLEGSTEYTYLGGWVGGYCYRTSYTRLERGSASGCVWCTFLLEYRQKYIASPATEPLSPKGAIKVRVGRMAPTVRAISTQVPMGVQELRVVLEGSNGAFWGHVYTTANDPAAPYVVARAPVLDVGSRHALSLASALIDGCVNTHERCISIAEPDAPLPTRLIDCSNLDRPRLVTTAGRRGRYLALSYVWGEAQPHQTLEAKLASYSAGIDASILPGTIRDALYVTHALGVQYLWTDSLCIIQDSDADKRNEIGNMHHVYRYAHLTIIVASARKVSEGFLQARNAPPHDVALPFICPAAPRTRAARAPRRKYTRQPEVGEVRICPRWVHTDTKSPQWNCYDHTQEPISQRAWCLQELYMSPRALIFTSESLQFRCQLATQTVGGAFFYAGDERRPLPDLLFRPPAARAIAPRSDAWWDVYAQWGAVVEDYMARAITEPSDKLLACGAIAEAFARVLRSDYLAGLWRHALLQDLLWYSHPETSLVRVVPYRAPSWSWAAVEGKIMVWGRHYHKGTAAAAEVVRCEVVLRDAALPFGQLVGASLVLRAMLIPCYLRRREHDALVHDLLFTLASSQGTGIPEDRGETSQKRSGPVVSEARLRLVDSTADAGTFVAWLVPLVRGHVPETVHGLVVVRVESAEDSSVEGRTVYRRIGTFDLLLEWEALQGEAREEVELV